MNTLLTAEEVGNYIQTLVSVQNLWAGKNVSIVVIANPKAGSFTQKKRSLQARALFEEAVKRAASKRRTVLTTKIQIYYTQYPRHASELTDAVICDLSKSSDSQNEQALIVAAGGDGTSLEIQTALFLAAHESEEKRIAVMEKCTILRLPLGTGNDGTDGHTLDETIRLLEGPVHLTHSCAIKVYHEGLVTHADLEATGKAKDLWNANGAPWYAFNIASIGIDAFITYMTNRMKSLLPGDSYQLWVNVAAAFYDTRFPAREAVIEIINNDRTIETVRTKIEFVLLGASGHRTYGSNHHILPDDNNICLTPKLSLISKLVNMNAFSDGTHVAKKLSRLFTADKIRISYDGSILVQMDGEAHLLCAKHFPLIMEQTEPCVRVIKSGDHE